MKTKLSDSPYFDNTTTDYSTVAFKAGYPVQARELNELQRITRTQTSRFADHVFKANSKVSGPGLKVSKVDLVTVTGSSSDYTVGQVLTGETSQVTGKIISITSLLSGSVLLAIDYINSGSDGITQCFLVEELIDTSNTVLKVSNGLIGTLQPTVFYTNSGFYEFSNTDGILLSTTTNPINLTVGLVVTEKLITASDDSELYDNAQGFANYSNPGADRILVSGELIADTDVSSYSGNFIKLAQYDDQGVLSFLLTRTDYADLMTTLAERTMDANGHFTVNTQSCAILEDTEDSNYIKAVVKPFKGYVNGYLVETISDKSIAVRRGLSVSPSTKWNIGLSTSNKFQIAKVSSGPNIPASPTPNRIYAIYPITSSGSVIAPGAGILPIGYAYISAFEFLNTTSNYNRTIGTAYFNYITTTTSDLTKNARRLGNTDELGYIEIGAYFIEMNPDGTLNSDSVFNIARTSSDSTWVDFGNHLSSIIDISDENTSVKTIVGDQGSVISASRLERITLQYVNGYYSATAPTGKTFYDPNPTGSTELYVTVSDGSSYTTTTMMPIASLTGNQILLQDPVGYGAAFTIGYCYLGVKTDGLTLINKTLINRTQVISLTGQTSVKLDKADVLRINSIQLHDGTVVNYSNYVNVDLGKTDHYVTCPTITKKDKTAFTNNSGAALVVDYDYFNWSTGDFVSIDSYTDNLNTFPGFSLTDLKDYISSDDTTFKLSNVIDFRPLINIVDLADNPSDSNSNSFEYVSTYRVNKNPALNGSKTEYLPRVDSICVDQDNNIFIETGHSGISPTAPKTNQNYLVLFNIKVPAGYRDISEVKWTLVDSTRFTMTDIRKLSTRVSNVEYATTITALEDKTLNMSILDADGNNRFKNGILVEAFNDYYAADLTNTEFAGSTDKTCNEFKPLTEQFSTQMVPYDKDTNELITDGIIVPSYTEYELISQPYYSKSVSLNPYYVVSKPGKLVLFPQIDTWADTYYEPAITVTNDSSVSVLSQVTNRLGLEWGSWSATNKVMQVESSRDSSTSWSALDDSNTNSETNVISSKTESNTVKTTHVESLTGISINPYMRSRRVMLVAEGLKPNTSYHFFLDETNIDEYCGDLLIDPSVYSIVSKGQSVYSDSTGMIYGYFDIPKNTFLSGDHEILISPATDYQDIGEYSSYAKSIYYSGGVSAKKQVVDYNVITPIINNSFVTQNKVSTTTSNITTQSDPLAQSFSSPIDCMISSISVMFESVDSTQPNGAWLEIVNTNNGYPGTTSYGRVDIKTSDITTGEWTKFVFNVPVFIKAEIDYAFVIGANSPEFRIKVARVGQLIDGTDTVIQTQVNTGSSFRSQNSKTWTAEQFEDLAFKINVAKFSSLSHEINFKSSVIDGYPEVSLIHPKPSDSSINYVVKSSSVEVGDQFKIIAKSINVRIYNSNGFSVFPKSGDVVTAINATYGNFKGIINSCYSYSTTAIDIDINIEYGYLYSNQTVTIISKEVDRFNNIAGSTLYKSYMSKTVDESEYTITGTCININNNPLPSGLITNSIGTVSNVSDTISFNATGSIIDTALVEKDYTVTDLVMSKRMTFNLFNMSGIYSSNGCEVSELTSVKTGANLSSYQTTQSMKNDVSLPTYGVIDPAWMNSTNIITYKISFASASYFVAPVINADTFRSVMVNRIVTKSDYSTSELVGNTNNQQVYVSKTLSLKNEARDLRVIFDLSKPASTDVRIYFKLGYFSNELSEQWIELPTRKALSFATNSYTDRVEVDILASSVLPSTFINQVSPYVDEDAITAELTGTGSTQEQIDQAIQDAYDSIPAPFTSVKLKVVGYSDDKSVCPILSNLRIIALT